MDWLIYADLDWETISQKPKEACPGIAGAAFGAGWWCWYMSGATNPFGSALAPKVTDASITMCMYHRVDAFVHGATVRHQAVPITYHIPGWVATAALIIMNLTSRTQLAEIDDSYEDDSFKVTLL